MLIGLSLCLSGTAAAQDSSPEPDTSATAEEARELFGRGVELSREERWGEAIEYFRRSAAVAPRPSTTFNIALALLRLGKPNEAKAMLTLYLTQSEGIEREDVRRAQSAELMDLAESSIATLTLEVSPPETALRVDGVLVEGAGGTRVLSLDPGAHAIRGTLEGFTPGTLELSLLEGAQVAESLSLAARTDPARVRITSNVTSASIQIDGEEVGRGSYAGELDAGSYRIDVRAEEYEPYRRDLEVSPLDRVNVTASLARIDSDSVWRNPWLWVAVGVVVLGAGIGVGVGVASSGTAPAYGGTTGVVLQGLTGR
ncbi:MAG: PEGA domain-containing protein [Deltaproteobacteria bacterium]|nr:PEGA domain-containing protein [Deltaproteobacteria bacterium]